MKIPSLLKASTTMHNLDFSTQMHTLQNYPLQTAQAHQFLTLQNVSDNKLQTTSLVTTTPDTQRLVNNLINLREQEPYFLR